MGILKIRALLAALVIALHAPAAWCAGAALWMPLTPGESWAFTESGRWLDSSGATGSYGPDREDIVFSAVNRIIGPHQATLQSSNGWFLVERADGYYRVGEDDPLTDVYYTINLDPKPFFTTRVLEQGESYDAAGAATGQWRHLDGSVGLWTGNWTQTLTHVGNERVTVPLGTFDAIHFRWYDTSTRSGSSTDRVSFSDWTDDLWFVPGVGPVLVVGSGTSWDDDNRDGSFERWHWETLTMQAIPVPEPHAGALMLAGLLVGLALRRRSAA